MADNTEIRRTLQNLLPGTTYATRVRALNEFGQYSEWSEALEFTAEASASASYTLVAPTAPTIQPQINALTILMNYAFTNDGISLYKIQHSTDNVTFSTIATSQIPLYVHQVSPGTTHYYRYTVTDVYGTESPVSPSNSGQSVAAFSHKPYATVVVASSTSAAEGAENADFVCDGVDDHVQLLAAAELAASGSTDGKVLLLDGEFYVGDSVGYAGTWEGMGIYATSIYVENDFGGTFMEGESIKNMSVIGQSNNITGYVVNSYANLENVEIRNFGDSTDMVQATGNINGIICENGFRGLITTGSYGGPRITNSWFNNLTMAIEVDQPSLISNSKISNCEIGVIFNHEGMVTGCTFDAVDLAMEMNSGGVTVVGNFIDSQTDATTVAIRDHGDSLIASNNFVGCHVETHSETIITSNHFWVQPNQRALHVKYITAGAIVTFTNNRVNHLSSAIVPGIPPIRIDNSVQKTLINGNIIKVYATTGAFSDAGISTNYGAGNYVNGTWVAGAGIDKHYTHTQGSANVTWTVNHNLNTYPSIITVDNSGVQMFGTVTYTNANTITVTWGSAQSGKAYCN